MGGDLVPKVLKWATEEVENPDCRDRGFMYWRLLSTDPTTAREIVLSEKPAISTETDRMDRQLLDQLLLHGSSLASIFHRVPNTFIRGSKARYMREYTENLEGIVPMLRSYSDVFHLPLELLTLNQKLILLLWTMLQDDIPALISIRNQFRNHSLQNHLNQSTLLRFQTIQMEAALSLLLQALPLLLMLQQQFLLLQLQRRRLRMLKPMARTQMTIRILMLLSQTTLVEEILAMELMHLSRYQPVQVICWREDSAQSLYFFRLVNITVPPFSISDCR